MTVQRRCAMRKGRSGWGDMKHDLQKFLDEMTLREKVRSWVRFYWRPTRWWVSKLMDWWEDRRYGPVPPIEKDNIALHYGWVDGTPACTDGPICAAHGWRLSPFVEEHRRGF